MYAPLIGEADIRTMAQSLGKSMNGGKNLNIAPMVVQLKKDIKVDKSIFVSNGHETMQALVNEGIPFVNYEVTIELNKGSKDLEQKAETSTSSSVKNDGKWGEVELKEDEYLVWKPPFKSITKSNTNS